MCSCVLSTVNWCNSLFHPQGTPFMAHLSVCLLYYIHDRMSNVPAWKDIKVGHVYYNYVYIK